MTVVTTAATRRSVPVELGSRAYRIDIGHGSMRDPDAFRGLCRSPASAVAIVSDDTVAPLYADRLATSLAGHAGRIVRVVVPAGEASKTLATFERIQTALLDGGLDRHSVVFALGGGVVGDLAGFAAGCFQRGIGFVQVPTTLLAQVDSSVGGKTGVNHPSGKNLIGVFHQPLRVVCDLETLDTLPARELAAGLAETIKIAAVADPAFLDRIEAELPALLAREPVALASAVARACALKAQIVGEDEREEGRRAVLNFGHTFGHAIEAGSGYGTWLHGEAVACGMALAGELSSRLGLLEPQAVRRLRALLAAAGLPLEPPSMRMAEWVDRMRGDKKATGGELRFVLLEGFGRAVVRGAPAAALAATLAEIAHAR